MKVDAAGLASTMTVAARVAAACRRNGVDIVFGQCNPVGFHLAVPAHRMRNITYRTENAGGAMADGYARISRQVAVVSAQGGPAAALLVAPLAEALKSSVPIVALVQDVAASVRERNAFQDLDHFKLFAGCTKWVSRIDAPNRVDDLVDMAFRIAASGRCGPVVLLLPADIAQSLLEGATARSGNAGRFPLDPGLPAPERVMEAARLLAGAQRPLVIAGGGVHLSGAAEALANLQDEFDLPVATTMMGKGAVSELHPLSLGVIGNVMATGAPAFEARTLITDADVVLLVGTRTAQNGTDQWSQYPRNAGFIHIDIDPVEIGRNYEALRLVGDARLTLEALAAALARQDKGLRKAARPKLELSIASSIATAQRLQRAVRSDARKPIRPEHVMHELDLILPQGAIVAADASYSSIWTTLFLTARRAGDRFLVPRGLAGIGWGLPLAIGAKLASPQSAVVAVVGDGGFGHVWGELETIRRHGIKLVIIVLNNEVLAMQQDMEVFRFGAHTDTQLGVVDHAAIARACGLNGVVVRDPETLRPALLQAFADDCATLLDIHTDPVARPPQSAYQSLPSQLG